MANPLSDPNEWVDQNANTPPSQWNGVAYEWFGVFGVGQPSQFINYIGSMASVPASFSVSVSTGVENFSIPHSLRVTFNGTDVQEHPLTPSSTEVLSFTSPATVTSIEMQVVSDSGEGIYPYAYSMDVAVTPIAQEESYNCDCDCGFPTETLAQIRAKIASLMGYSAQIADLPASVKLAILTNLNLAQSMVVNDLNEIKSDRYFSWPVEPGETKFCVYENQETCRNIMVATRVREAYFVGDGNVITRLDKGIPFQYYEAENPRSVPSRYQVRSCIEIWPPPVAAGTLVVRGTLAAVDLADDTDKVVVDKDALLLRTVAFMKSAKGHADAANYMGQYWEVIGALCSDSHMDESYVPGWLPRDSRLRECLTHHMEPRTYG